jgi:hypothetical protein
MRGTYSHEYQVWMPPLLLQCNSTSHFLYCWAIVTRETLMSLLMWFDDWMYLFETQIHTNQSLIQVSPMTSFHCCTSQNYSKTNVSDKNFTRVTYMCDKLHVASFIRASQISWSSHLTFIVTAWSSAILLRKRACIAVCCCFCLLHIWILT